MSCLIIKLNLNSTDAFILFVCASACLSVGKKFEVPVENGLNEEKALEILALYVNGKPQKLPEQARSIVGECKGTNDLFYANVMKCDPVPKKCCTNSLTVRASFQTSLKE